MAMMMILSVARMRNGENPIFAICIPICFSGRMSVSGIFIVFLRSVHSTKIQDDAWAITVAAAAPAMSM